MKRHLPGLTLLLLAPVLGELVSAHQAPLEFINPLNFLVLSLPYGFGALICRELVVRWKKGLLSLILLGAAYGVYEEAIVVYSIFDSSWNELGALARDGTFAGVKWTWGELTVHFHALVSIGASVVLAELLYPDRRHERWLSNRLLAACGGGLLLWMPIMGWISSAYLGRAFPPLGWYILSWLAIIVLGWAAWRLPGLPLPSVRRSPPRPIGFFLLGLVNMSAFFLAVFLTPDFGWPPLAVTVIGLLAYDGLTVWLLLRWSANGRAWDDRHRLALFAGFLGFFIYFGFDKDFDHWQGASLISLLVVAALWILGRAVARRFQSREEDRKGSPGGAI